MAAMTHDDVTIRRWRRVEYDTLVELGMFDGERLELLDGLLVVREPQQSYHASTVMQVGRVLEAAFGAPTPSLSPTSRWSPVPRSTMRRNIALVSRNTGS